MKLVAEVKDVRSPAWWVDQGMFLAALWQDLKDEMTKYEMLYKSEIADFMEEGDSKSKAEIKVQGRSENYKTYMYLRARDKIIDEFIKLAKKRATLEEYVTYQ